MTTKTCPAGIWPAGKCCGVLVTVNLDAESVDLHETSKDNLFGRFSYGRYGMRAGLERLLDEFRGLALSTTVFVPGLDAENNPRAIEAIRLEGHEIAARGYAFEDHGKLAGKERETLEHAHKVLAGITGTAPVGWRAPFGAVSRDTLRYLTEMGYLYDSSFLDDDTPYVMASPTGRSIVELPRSQALDDSSLYEPRHSHTRALKTWKEEFDANYAEGALVNLTLHPRGDYGSGRAARARVVGEFLGYVARHPGVWFATCAEMAAWWKQAHPATEPFDAGIAPL